MQCGWLAGWLLAEGEFVGDSCVYRSKPVQELTIKIYFITPAHILEYEFGGDSVRIEGFWLPTGT